VHTRLSLSAYYYWIDDSNHTGGIFIFSISGQLAGLEVYSKDGECDVSHLPDLNRLVPIEFTENSG